MLRPEPHSRPLQISVFLVSGVFPWLLLSLQIAKHDVIPMPCVVGVLAASDVTCQEGAFPGSDTLCAEAHSLPTHHQRLYTSSKELCVGTSLCIAHPTSALPTLESHDSPHIQALLVMARSFGLLNVGKLGFESNKSYQLTYF